MDKKSLLELKNKLAGLPVLQERLQKLKGLINEADDQVVSLLKKYEAESLDVEKIQKDSLSTTILKLVGKYEDRVDKETQEMLQAKMEYDAAVHRMEELKKERGELSNRIADLTRDKRTFEDELQRREELIKSRITGEASEEYRKLEAHQDYLLKQLTETQEALRAATKALDTARRAKESLDSAENWATYDMWFKSGIIGHLAKYDHIDSAQSYFDALSSQIRDLQKELKDINLSADFFPSQIDSSTRAIDFWFDNIFTDMRVRDQIRGNKEQIRSLHGKINGVIGKLEGLKSSISGQIRDSERKMNELIINVFPGN